jgi:hypothetical protein
MQKNIKSVSLVNNLTNKQYTRHVDKYARQQFEIFVMSKICRVLNMVAGHLDADVETCCRRHRHSRWFCEELSSVGRTPRNGHKIDSLLLRINM